MAPVHASPGRIRESTDNLCEFTKFASLCDWEPGNKITFPTSYPLGYQNFTAVQGTTQWTGNVAIMGNRQKSSGTARLACFSGPNLTRRERKNRQAQIQHTPKGM